VNFVLILLEVSRSGYTTRYLTGDPSEFKIAALWLVVLLIGILLLERLAKFIGQFSPIINLLNTYS